MRVIIWWLIRKPL